MLMFEYIDLIRNNFNKKAAKIHTKNISKFYRSHGSKGYEEAFNYIYNEIKDQPFEKIEIETFPLNSSEGNYPAWEPIKVETKIIEPIVEKLISFNDIPTCITWYSKSTPPGGVIAEVCDVGYGLNKDDYNGLNLKGKIALATGNSPEDTLRTYDLAVKTFGAIGIISDCLIGPIPGYRTKEITPDFVSLNRLSRKYNDSWAIIISGRMGARIRELLKKSVVKIHVEIEAKTFDGEGKSLVTTLKGSDLPNQEIIIIGHVTNPEPNANCASGPALMIELSKSFFSIIKKNKLLKPKRTIKFLFVPEGSGSIAYVENHKKNLKNIIGALCLCGIGQNQDLSKSFLTLSRTTDSTPSYLNDLSYSFLEKSVDLTNPSLKYKEIPYSPFSDNSTFNMASIPTILLSSEPNIFFHTQFLTWETTSEEVFNVSACVIGGIALFNSNANLLSVIMIINLTKIRSQERLIKKEKIYNNQLLKKSVNNVEEFVLLCNEEINYIIERDSIAIESCKNIINNQLTKKFINESKDELISHGIKIKDNLKKYASFISIT